MNVSMKIRDKIKRVAERKGFDINERGVISELAKLHLQKIDFKAVSEDEYFKTHKATYRTFQNFFLSNKPYTSETLDKLCTTLDVTAVFVESKEVI